MSAPQRMLVIDGADAVAEGMLEQLRYLVAEAHSADVSVVAITAADNKQVVRDTLAERFGKDVIEHVVPALTDAQVDEVVATFGELANLAKNERSRELLRLPVVLDLLVRGGISGVPLSVGVSIRKFRRRSRTRSSSNCSRCWGQTLALRVRQYGDGHVWIWYRGTGVGSYPCMSALQALERVCDELIGSNLSISRIVATLLDGCENLAMVGLVAGLLVRHLERADRLLDPYLAEPVIWHEEFNE